MVIRRRNLNIKFQDHFPELLCRFIQNIILRRSYSLSGENNTNISSQECRLLEVEMNVATQTKPHQNFE